MRWQFNPTTRVGLQRINSITGAARSTMTDPAPNGQKLMPMESHESAQFAAALANRVEKGADASRIAEASVAIWKEIDVALRSVIGQRGVAALYKRSLYLASAFYPWLAGLHGSVPSTAIDLAPFAAAIAKQTGADAFAGSVAMLEAFHALLTTLVGPSLTERLLRSVWEDSSRGSLSQDISA